jgi:hypothetical protein
VGKVSVVIQRTAGGRVLNDIVSTKLKYEMKKKAQSAPQVKKVMEAKRDAILREGMAYYGGMLHTLEDILGYPQMEHFASGGRMSQTRTVTMPPGAVAPTPIPAQKVVGEGRWRKLSDSYIKKHPKSVTYWSKTYGKGSLAVAFTGLLASGTLPKALVARSSYGKTALKRTDGDILTAMHMRVDYPALHGNFLLDRLIRVSFAKQSAIWVPTPRGKGAITPWYRSQPLNHLLLAEGGPFKRPFVAKFAAQMGKAWMTALRKMERGNRV